MSELAREPRDDEGVREIRRYSNRKLYDSATRRFTSLSAIDELVRSDVDLVVIDHDTGEDLTAETLRRLLGARKRNSDNAVDSTGLLVELIRSPSRIATAMAEGERDVKELRELREQVNSLSAILDSLLADDPDDSAPDAPTADGANG